MSKNIFYAIYIIVISTLLFSACRKEIIPVSGITLDLPAITLVVDTTITLTATIQPVDAFNQAITWTSNNITVATVDQDGIVTAKAPGTATITVTTQDGGFTASCEITIKTPVISVSDISLNKNTLFLIRDDPKNNTEILIATISPENATNQIIIWTSSNETVATVSSEGKVTAKAPGTATIIATTEDGGKTASCAVTVTIVQVTEVTLNRTAFTLDEGKSFTLIATVSPINSTNKTVTWTSSNKNVASVDNQGVVRGISSGTATITVTTQDGNKTATCVITVQPCGCGW